MIPPDKSCIFLDGSGFRVTEIQWNDHATTATSPTFTSYAQNLVVQGITFRVYIYIYNYFISLTFEYCIYFLCFMSIICDAKLAEYL